MSSSENSQRDAAIQAISEEMGHALRAFAAGGFRLSAYGLATVPEGDREQIQQLVDSRLCAVNVQIDLPACNVRVLVWGPSFQEPLCLLNIVVPQDDDAGAEDSGSRGTTQ
jgi:hypothetical protein